mmetsp:Transcript_28304/g.50560  ORF Transcript_28304/g.50560 Transcript_28304/m.50560 type:complete len:267 (+) Transcript_28304:282-1082(+)
MLYSCGHKAPCGSCHLNKVRNIHGHFIYLCAVVLLNIAQNAHIVVAHKIDGHALSTEAARAADAVDVELAVVGQVVVDDEGDVLHVQPARPDVGGDEHAGTAATEFAHDGVALFLRHVAVHRRDGEVVLPHLLRQPVHLALGVAKDDGLCDGEGVVEVAESVKLPLLALHRHKKLLDALQRQLIALHQHAHGVRHKLVRHLQHLVRQRRRNQHNLRVGGEVAVDVVDLFLEPLGQHLVCLVQHQRLDVARAQRAALNHVKHAPRRA